MTTTLPASTASHVDVTYLDGEAYEIAVRNHRVRVDQPEHDAGADQAPTPTELFVGSPAACVAFYAGRYVARHGYDREGLYVHAGFTMSNDRPARVTDINITVRPPADFPAEWASNPPSNSAPARPTRISRARSGWWEWPR